MMRAKDSLALMLLLVIAFMSGANLNAQQKAPQPKDVFAFYGSQDKSMFLEWSITNDYERVTTYYAQIYHLKEDSTIVEMPKIKIDVNDPMLKSYVEKGFARFSFYYPNYSLDKGFYYINMYSVTQDGESELSLDSYFMVDDGINQNTLYISEIPEMFGFVGQQYVSKVTAKHVNDDDVTINYTLQKGPEGMTVNSENGVIEFTPETSGFYDFWITASVVDNPDVYVDFYGYLQVFECENPGIIRGGLKFSDKLEKKVGMIYAYRFDAAGNLTYGTSQEVHDDGKFELTVDKGNYYLFFQSYELIDDFIDMGEWYKDAANIESAQTVPVDCGETVQIEWNVGESMNYTKYEISGSAKLEDGTPLPYSTVVFETISDSLNFKYFTKSTMTDENGNYSILLPDIFDYRASCYATNGEKPGSFRPKYWENTFNPMEATIIDLKADVSGINFTFKKEDFEIPDGSISGKVMNSSNVPIESAFVIAFKVKSEDGKNNDDLYQGYAAITDENGFFKFDYMSYGEYVLFSFPNDMNYAPGFYREDDIAALTWEEATVILHDGFNPTKDRNIILPLMDIVYGEGKIEGTVTSQGGGIKNESQGTKISGASIFLVNQQGVTNKYNKSSNNGDYKLTSVAPGKYEFIVDKVGYRTHREMVEVGEDGIISGHNIELIPESLSSVEDLISKDGISLYPNPANSNINLMFDGEVGSSTIEVYDLLGTKLLSSNISTIFGENFKNINTNELPAGQYIIKIINSNNTVKFSRFVITK